MNEQKITIYTTNDYSLFKRLKGNRDLTNKRIAIIKASIEAVGYISNPIIVNEAFEVIDGQGRCEALKQLSLPVEYRIIHGIGINECRAMNLKPTSWTINDFIESYAEFDVDGYVKLKKLHEEYGFGYQLLYSLTDQSTISGRRSQDNIRGGAFKMTDEQYKYMRELCDYLSLFKDIQKKIGGRAEAFYGCIGWCAQLKGVDRDRLNISIHQQRNCISPVAKTEPTLREISEVYNKGYSKKNRRDFSYEWKYR